MLPYIMILLYLTDDTTSNITAWIPGRNTVIIINKYTIIKVHPSDFGFQEKNHSLSHTRFHELTVMSSRECQEDKHPASRGCQAEINTATRRFTTAKFSKSKIVQHSPVPENSQKSNSAIFRENTLRTLPDDFPYLLRSIRNLQHYELLVAKALEKLLVLNEKKTILAIMDEVKKERKILF